MGITAPNNGGSRSPTRPVGDPKDLDACLAKRIGSPCINTRREWCSQPSSPRVIAYSGSTTVMLDCQRSMGTASSTRREGNGQHDVNRLWEPKAVDRAHVMGLSDGRHARAVQLAIETFGMVMTYISDVPHRRARWGDSPRRSWRSDISAKSERVHREPIAA